SPELRVIARSELLLDPGCDALPWSIALPIVAGEGEPFGAALAELLQGSRLDLSNGLRRSDDCLRAGRCRRALVRCFGHDQRPPVNEGVSMARTMPSARRRASANGACVVRVSPSSPARMKVSSPAVGISQSPSWGCHHAR